MSKLKTIWDVINELRGDLNNTYFFNNTKDAHLFYNLIDGDYVCDITDDEKLACTIAEFNELVEEMKIGLDVNPVNHGYYLNYVNADKTLLEKEVKPDYTSLEFWKDAPDGATHCVPSKYGASYYKLVCGERLMLNEKNGDGWVASDNRSDFLDVYKSVVNRPQSTLTETPEEKEALDSIVNKPLVYTQEMADNGELPSVGMKIKLQYNQFSQPIECELLFISDQYMIAKKDNFEQHYHRGTWKPEPIETRTKKEKAIDDMVEQLTMEGIVTYDNIILKILIEKFVGNKITGVKWVGE
tara:strand:- start:12945 stop:13838 length:894 start_codon:yes stop_codon:yes gene_type:complete